MGSVQVHTHALSPRLSQVELSCTVLTSVPDRLGLLLASCLTSHLSPLTSYLLPLNLLNHHPPSLPLPFLY